ncbi:helix-turn-helix domain-containing protein [Embleya hyalina]|uniref:DNA-binding protein n=1 Tax=Embleya hyalina TaxID=516124 RepID=A0A401YDG7_9ACTN|nr:helix-turn-helix domain-containing protein [Embleya hyalina]GCD92628.1 DNA-binding protein [Embleya hyalina]
MTKAPGDQEAIARNRARQTQWYGEPLQDRFRRLLGRLGASQLELAALLGLSAPMLSQLMSGQRAKIGNPAVLSRLQEVEALVASADFERLPDADRVVALERIRSHQPSTRTALRLNGPEVLTGPAADPAVSVQAVLRAAASAAEIEAAAELLAAEHPGLAEVLRVYGNGRTADAREHFRAVVPLSSW